MDKDEQLLECYKLYIESKERFTDRSFRTNKFYLVLIIILMSAVAYYSNGTTSSAFIAVLSGLGFAISALWWFNQDSYQYLIKVKYKNVIEEMEKQLPFAACTEEFKAAQEKAKKNNLFVFNNAHKTFAFLVLLIFLAFFIMNFTPIIATTVMYGSI